MRKLPIIHNRLRELRESRKLTQVEVSKITGLDQGLIARHENCTRGLSDSAIDLYAALYKVPTHELFLDYCADDNND